MNKLIILSLTAAAIVAGGSLISSSAIAETAPTLTQIPTNEIPITPTAPHSDDAMGSAEERNDESASKTGEHHKAKAKKHKAKAKAKAKMKKHKAKKHMEKAAEEKAE